MTSHPPAATSGASGGHIRTNDEIGVIKYPVRPEDWFAFRHADWNRLYRRVKSLANPLPYIGQVGWACVGIGAGALVALLPWIPADAQLPTAAHNHYAWMTPALFILGVASFVVAAACLYANKIMHDRDATTVKEVLEDMDACYAQHKTTEAGKIVNEQIRLDQDLLSWWSLAFLRDSSPLSTKDYLQALIRSTGDEAWRSEAGDDDKPGGAQGASPSR